MKKSITVEMDLPPPQTILERVYNYIQNSKERQTIVAISGALYIDHRRVREAVVRLERNRSIDSIICNCGNTKLYGVKK